MPKRPSTSRSGSCHSPPASATAAWFVYLVDSQIDRPRLRFLEQDRGGLQLFAKAIEDIQFVGAIRAVRPGAIVFAQQPFADITGAFGLTQAQEIKFEHAFDLP